MKKPLILLVDDDLAVLEALETTLGPLFGEICRIESFVDPEEVLRATVRWVDESRPIAVAIVDQKMPGMTGVELVKQLRALRSSTLSLSLSGFKAVMLTGYAGLDSAIEGKNEASIDRYLEKPWDTEVLVGMIRDLVLQYVTASSLDTHYVFREVAEEIEVRDHLALRYEVYRHTGATEAEYQHAFDVLLPPSRSGMDLDAYDAVSRLFSLFESTISGTAIVGTLRVVGQDPGHARDVLESIVRHKSDLRARLLEARRYPLSMMTYLEDREAVQRVFERLTGDGERVVEAGRLTLRLSHRSSGRQLASHIIEGAISFYFYFLGIENTFIDCRPSHVPMYRRYGFREIEGVPTKYQPGMGADVACLHGARCRVPSARRDRLVAMSKRISRTGGACRCDTYPACMPLAYETGDFRDSDEFCPIRAKEVLVTQ